MVLFRLANPVLPVHELCGQGVVLRTPQIDDFAAWAQLREQSRSFLVPWEPLWPEDDLTKPAFRRRLRRYGDEMREESAYTFFLFDESGETLLGGLTLSNIRRGVTQSCALGYWMGVSHAGKGHMGAGVAAVLPFVFDHLRLHRLEAACLPTNAPSIAVLEKAGFTREGYARQFLCIAGVWQDHLTFAMLASDFHARSAQGMSSPLLLRARDIDSDADV